MFWGAVVGEGGRSHSCSGRRDLNQAFIGEGGGWNGGVHGTPDNRILNTAVFQDQCGKHMDSDLWESQRVQGEGGGPSQRGTSADRAFRTLPCTPLEAVVGTARLLSLLGPGVPCWSS